MVGAVEQFAQRIAIRFHLKSLDEKEARQYIAFRLQRAGAERPLFTAEALDLVWERTAGVPRVINTLCDLCLLEGLASKASVVDGRVVRRALASL
jgi:type II secretory pathway predicted ATPase ExeA